MEYTHSNDTFTHLSVRFTNDSCCIYTTRCFVCSGVLSPGITTYATQTSISIILYTKSTTIRLVIILINKYITQNDSEVIKRIYLNIFYLCEWIHWIYILLGQLVSENLISTWMLGMEVPWVLHVLDLDRFVRRKLKNVFLIDAEITWFQVQSIMYIMYIKFIQRN